jgi:hypothetical protein
MQLLKKTQLAAIIETLEGVYQAPSSTDLIPVLQTPSIELSLEQIDRSTARGDLTMPLAVPSFRKGKCSFQMEAQGAKAGIGTLPAINLPLLACGMNRTAAKRVTVAAASFSAQVYHGATFVQATSGATGTVLGSYLPGDLHFYFSPTTGTVDAAHVITFTNPTQYGGSPTVATPNAGFALQDAYCWNPDDTQQSQIATSATVGGGGITTGDEILGVTSGARGIARNAVAGVGTLQFLRFPGGPHFGASETIQKASDATKFVTSAGVETQVKNPSLTLMTLHDNTLRKAIKGARGTFKVDLNNGDRPLFSFDFQGCGVQVVDGVNFAYPGDTMFVPNVVTGGKINFDALYPPNFSKLSFDLGATLSERESPNDTTATGYESFIVSGRDCKGSIDPETIRESLYSFAAQAKAWFKTQFRIRARCGPGGDGNTFEFMAIQAQIQSPKEGERAQGLMMSDLPLVLRGDGNDELLIFLS